MSQSHLSKTEEVKPSKFWKHQPVALSGTLENLGARPLRSYPLDLPPDFEWAVLDTKDPKVLDEVINFLAKHYPNIKYPQGLLEWYFNSDSHFKIPLGIRVSQTRALVGFIFGRRRPVVFDQVRMIGFEINQLCVHAKCRKKGMAPVLIKEATRRILIEDPEVQCAIYIISAKTGVPNEFCQNTIYQRPINTERLITNGYFGDFGRESAKTQFNIPSKWKPTERFGLLTKSNKELLKELATLANAVPALSKTDVSAEYLMNMLSCDQILGFYLAGEKGDENSGMADAFCCLAPLVYSNGTRVVEMILYGFRESYMLSKLIKFVLWHLRDKDVADVLNCMNDASGLAEDTSLRFIRGTTTMNMYVYNFDFRRIHPNENALLLM